MKKVLFEVFTVLGLLLLPGSGRRADGLAHAVSCPGAQTAQFKPDGVDDTRSTPLVFTTLRNALRSSGTTSASACMKNLRRLLKPTRRRAPARPSKRSTQTPSFSAAADQTSTSWCFVAKIAFLEVRNFASLCYTAKPVSTVNADSNNSHQETETSNSELTAGLLSNLTDALDLANEKVRRCCSGRTSAKTVSSPVACLLQERIGLDLQELHELLVALDATESETNQYVASTQKCRRRFSSLDGQLRQIRAVIARSAKSTTPETTASPQPQLPRIRTPEVLADVIKSVNQVERLTRIASPKGRRPANVSLRASPDVLLLVCSALFPVCESNVRVPPCSSTCKNTEMLLRSSRVFVNTESIPILSILEKAVKTCVLKPLTNSSCLLEQGTGFTVVNSTSTRSATGGIPRKSVGGFCLNSECKSPLRSTSDSSHFDKRFQRSLRSLYERIKSIFPNSTLPFNQSILPCGRECMSVGFTDHEHRVSQIIMTAFSSISVASVIFAFVVFYFNRQIIGRQFLRRVAMMFLAVGGIAQLPYLFSAKGTSGDSILCYSDGTLVTHPTSSDWCWWTAVQTHLFTTLSVGYTTVLTYSWQQLARALDDPAASAMLLLSSRDTWWTKYKNDLLAFLAVLVPPLAMVIAVAAQSGYEALPIFGVCSVSGERDFLGYYAWYHIACLVPNIVFLLRGVHVLVDKYGMYGFLQWMRRGDNKRKQHSVTGIQGGASRDTSRTAEGLKRFSRQMLIYLLLAMVNFLFNIIYGIYVQVNLDDWDSQATAHIECLITSCSPETCPPLPTPSVTIFTLPLVFSFISVFALTTWTYSPVFLVNVPGLRRLIKTPRRSHAARGSQMTLTTSQLNQTKTATSANLNRVK